MICGEYSAFTVNYDIVHVTYVFAGLDKEHSVIYVVAGTTGPWTMGSKKPRSVVCRECKSPMPLWVLDFNQYVK